MADEARSRGVYNHGASPWSGSWAWGDLETWEQVLDTAGTGWEEHLTETLALASEAVDTVERETTAT